jgi:hypothetical protein
LLVDFPALIRGFRMPVLTEDRRHAGAGLAFEDLQGSEPGVGRGSMPVYAENLIRVVAGDVIGKIGEMIALIPQVQTEL